MKKCFYLIIMLFSLSNLRSQGFDWQYSVRLPQKTPKLFLGLEGGFFQNSSTGEFPFVENRFTCCEFESGTGWGINLGLASEYWFRDLAALRIGLSYASFSGNFSKIRSFPVILDNDVSYMEEYEYDFETLQSYVLFSAGYKHKFGGTQLSFNADLNMYYLFLESNSSTESRIGPVEMVSPYTRSIPEGHIKGIRSFYVLPEFSLSYDVNLGLGMYSSLHVLAGLPLFSLTSDSEWRRWQIGVGFSIYKGFLIK